ncbi:hypothetical protein A4G20_08375 [Pasteurellaceae bacterium RH1A]|nr:hypothetical protein A4G20_08375 [Pasteurellaceae bacterium RH1A]
MFITYNTPEERKNIKSFLRITQLQRKPITGNFDREHLIAINAYIFQDSPEVAGVFRPEVQIDSNKLWRKQRELKGFGLTSVCYSNMSPADILQLDRILSEIHPTQYKKLSLKQFAKVITNLYARLDHIHPFPDGNSRTLREFFRQLAYVSGFKLNWNVHSQEVIYMARDVEVNKIMIASITNPIHIQFLREENQAIQSHKNYKPLEEVILASLSKQGKLE